MLASAVPDVVVGEAMTPSSRRSAPIVGNHIGIGGDGSWTTDHFSVLKSGLFVRCNLFTIFGTINVSGLDGRPGSMDSGDCCVMHVHGGAGGDGGSGGGGGSATQVGSYPWPGGYENDGADGSPGTASGYLAVAGLGGLGWGSQYVDGYDFGGGGGNGFTGEYGTLNGCGEAGQGGGSDGSCAASVGDGGPGGAGMVLIQCNTFMGTGTILAQGGNAIGVSNTPVVGAGGGPIIIMCRHFDGAGMNLNSLGGTGAGGCGAASGYPGAVRVVQINDDDSLAERNPADTF